MNNFATIITLILGSCSQAQNAKTLNGFVYDKHGNPVEAVTIAIRGTSLGTATDDKCFFGFINLSLKEAMHDCSKIGFERKSIPVQLSGLINYVTKSADSTKTFSFENLRTAGSFGLFSTYYAVGGIIGKWSYYGYISKRVSDGYRKNSESNADGHFASIQYNFNDNLFIKAEHAAAFNSLDLPTSRIPLTMLPTIINQGRLILTASTAIPTKRVSITATGSGICRPCSVVACSINNFTNKQHHTKRPVIYPDPGIWSSDGRSVYNTVGCRF